MALWIVEQAKHSSTAEADRDSPLHHGVLADVGEDAERFGFGLGEVQRKGGDYPCLVVDGADPIPIDTTSNDPRPWVHSRARGSLQRGVDRTLYSVMGRTLLRLSKAAYSFAAGIEHVPPSRATAYFRSNLERSLIKFVTPRADPDDDTVSFAVHTMTPHLRIHFAGAYFIRPEATFGQLSTPTRQRLRLGNYIFGAYDRTLGCVRYQDAVYEVPDATEAHLEF